MLVVGMDPQSRVTLAKNGVVERQNRTLVEAARTMLSAFKLPLFDEFKEMSETSVANDTSGLVPQRQKASDYDNSGPDPQLQNVSPSADTTVPSQQELDLLFGPLYDEFFNAGTSRVNKSSSPTDNSAQQDTLPSMNIHPTTEPSTPTHVNAEENNNDQAEFTNPFCTPVQEVAESSSRNIGNSNMHTFNQPQDSEYRWTKDHLLTQVRGNPSKPVQTRRQLATDPKMCMFALTVSTAKPKNIKEAMADSAWIEAMQEELHQFDRLQVWELVDKPFGKNIIKLKWLWKNKKDEDQTDHLKMEMEMEIPSSSNVKLMTECTDTTYTCYEVMKDLIKVSKLPQTLISYSSSQVHKMAINNSNTNNGTGTNDRAGASDSAGGHNTIASPNPNCLVTLVMNCLSLGFGGNEESSEDEKTMLQSTVYKILCDIRKKGLIRSRYDLEDLIKFISVGDGRNGLNMKLKTVDDKARYSAFRFTEIKSERPKALSQFDSHGKLFDHATEKNKTAMKICYDGGFPPSSGISDASGEMHAVPLTHNRNLYALPYKSDIEKTQILSLCKSKAAYFPAVVRIPQHQVTAGESDPAASRNQTSSQFLLLIVLVGWSLPTIPWFLLCWRCLLDEDNCCAHGKLLVVPEPCPPPDTDWRPWPSVPAHSPVRDHTNEPASPPTPPDQTVVFEVPLEFGPVPRPAGGFHEDSLLGLQMLPTPTADSSCCNGSRSSCLVPSEYIEYTNRRRFLLVIRRATSASAVHRCAEKGKSLYARFRYSCEVVCRRWLKPGNVFEEDRLLMAQYNRLEKDRLLSAQYNLFRPKPDITEPPSKRQRVERASSHPASVPAAPSPTVDDPDFAGGGSSNSAGGGGSHPAGSAFGTPVTDPTVSTSAAMDSAGSHREIGVSPFADSAASSSPSNVSTDHIPIDVLFASTSGGIHDFFLESDEEEQIGLSRVAADPDSDDEVLAEIIFRGESISGDGVVLVDQLPDDEIVDPRVKVETVSDYASSPPRNRRKHLGVRSDDCLWDKPVEDFFQF
ncbi:retrovirus-related pol polyprotein from transposon TNT 1-94 [Tanacetum coccineum]